MAFGPVRFPSYGCSLLLIICLKLISFTATLAGNIDLSTSYLSFQTDDGQSEFQDYFMEATGFSSGETVLIEIIDDAAQVFSISGDGSNYSTTLELTADTDGNINMFVQVRYAPGTQQGPHYATISHSAANTETKSLSLDGNIGTLPVELVDYKVETIEQSIILKWTTASESNNDRFEVELMKDLAKGFKKIGVVASKAINSTETISYKFEYPFYGSHDTWYIRLKQFDLDGSFVYSRVLFVTLPETAAGITLRVGHDPVSASSQLHISAPETGELHLIISDINGIEVYRTFYNIEHGENKFELDLNHQIPAGLYILTTTFKGRFTQLKLLM